MAGQLYPPLPPPGYNRPYKALIRPSGPYKGFIRPPEALLYPESPQKSLKKPAKIGFYIPYLPFKGKIELCIPYLPSWEAKRAPPPLPSVQ